MTKGRRSVKKPREPLYDANENSLMNRFPGTLTEFSFVSAIATSSASTLIAIFNASNLEKSLEMRLY